MKKALKIVGFMALGVIVIIGMGPDTFSCKVFPYHKAV